MTESTHITPLRVWMRAATQDERELMAQRAATTVGGLRQIANGHRQASADMAGRIEAASAVMAKASKGRLPKIVRTDICAACRACQYAAKCLGERAVVSDFPIVDARQLELDV